MTIEKRVQTTFRLSPKVLKEFKFALLDRGERMTPVIEGMIREWMHRRAIGVTPGSEEEGQSSRSDLGQFPGSFETQENPITRSTPVAAFQNPEFGEAHPGSSATDQEAGAVAGALALAEVAPTEQANDWVRLLGALEKKINRQAFATWLQPTRFSHRKGKTLYVRVPSSEFQFIGEKYGDLIQEAIDKLDLEIETVTFTMAQQNPQVSSRARNTGFVPIPAQTSTATPAAGSRLPERSRFNWSMASQLNPRYRFDHFIIGSGNQFAMAASQAVAERPSKAYNPLFLYGGVGMGKTHLMHAIGHEVRRRQPQTSICYVSGEKFVNELVDSIRHDRTTAFRDKFRNVDVLLLDDIQFLAGKERTQEEFFHTFNALHEGMKQIVISSDRPPKDLADFEDRLRSRFEWGLIADIQPPDLETKVAILQKKAESEQTQLPVDVALFIASSVRTNVRELEGALVRLIAWCSMHGVEINLHFAQQCLKQFIDTQVRKITVETIQRSVAELFGMRIPELKQKNNSRRIVIPRQIAMYLTKQLTDASFPEIGRQFGGKHHTTVMMSVSKIEQLRHSDKDLNRTINKLMETLFMTSKVILCVGENEQEISVLQFILKTNDYSTLSAGNAEEAIRVFTANQVDLVLSNYALPDRDGGQLINQLKKIAAHVPMILRRVPKEMDGLADIYLLKTQCSTAELLESIKTLMFRRKRPKKKLAEVVQPNKFAPSAEVLPFRKANDRSAQKH